MNSLLVCSICCILFQLTVSDGVTLTFTSEHYPISTGSRLEFFCYILKPFNKTIIEIWKGESIVATCSSYICSFDNPRYSFTANISGVFGNIDNVNKEDEGQWECRYSNGSGHFLNSNSVKVLVIQRVTLTFEIKLENNMSIIGSRVEFFCRVSAPFDRDYVMSISHQLVRAAWCQGDSYDCLDDHDGFCHSHFNSTGVFGTIFYLREQDEGEWVCNYRRGYFHNLYSNVVNMIVYAIPSGLSITQNPDRNVDLSKYSVELQCITTGCTHPVPSIKWIFHDQTPSSEIFYAPGNTTVVEENCTFYGHIDASVAHYPLYIVQTYRSILQLPLYTTINANIGKTGVFYCMIEYPNATRNIKSSVSHTVRFPAIPSGLSITQNPDAFVDFSESPVEMQCKTTGCTYPLPSIKWIFHDQTSSSDIYYSSGNTTEVDETCTAQEKIYTSTLHLPLYTTFNDNSDKTGTFYCIIEYPNASMNINSSLSHTVRFPVHVRNVTLDPPGDTITFLDGTSTSFRCTAGPSRPAAVIRWWLDGTEVTNLSKTNTTVTGSLFSASSKLDLMVNKTLQYKKVYCDARVKGQVIAIDSVKQGITVLYAPDVLVNVSGSMLTGSKAVLKCTANGKPPQYTFHPWIHRVGQTEIRRLNGVNTNSISILTLSSISIQDMGIYICNVDNSITGLDGQVMQSGVSHVLVQGPPSVGVTATVFTGEIGKSASIQIPFYSYSSKASVKFSKRLDELEISNDTSNASIYVTPSDIKMTFYKQKVTIPGYLAVLLLRNVTEKDFKKYTLQLSNENGIVTVEFEFAESESISTQSKDDTQLAGLGVGGVVGIALSGVAFGCIVAITIFIIRSRVHGRNRTCFKGMKKGQPHEPYVKYVRDDHNKSTEGYDIIINRQQQNTLHNTDILVQEGIAQNMDHGYLHVVGDVREDDGYLRPWTGISRIEDPIYNYIK